MEQVERWNYMANNVTIKDTITPKTLNVKASQFAQPLFEFSGACAGCGETPYIKLITQLFGDRMMVANATGCSSIYGGSAPATSYCANKEGKGVAWANSLFEDNSRIWFGHGHCCREIARPGSQPDPKQPRNSQCRNQSRIRRVAGSI
jgi:Pyruvate:ferredoxin oxidoreductase and related 2-oxoacid:ferredoxin oxidoreductases, beta subunit